MEVRLYLTSIVTWVFSKIQIKMINLDPGVREFYEVVQESIMATTGP